MRTISYAATKYGYYVQIMEGNRAHLRLHGGELPPRLSSVHRTRLAWSRSPFSTSSLGQTDG